MDGEYIELTNHRAIMELPETAVNVVLNIDVYVDGEIKTVTAQYGFNEIREMFKKADDGYIDDEDRFCLTDKGREYLDLLKE